MNRKFEALLFAVIIILFAVVSQIMGLSDSASFGIIGGMTGAAVGIINRKGAKGGCC